MLCLVCDKSFCDMFFFKPRNTLKGYSLWFLYFLSINALVVVHALKECNNVPGDVCKCRTDEGVIDLWKLAGTGSDVPRFKGITFKVADETGTAEMRWNPCNSWSVKPASLKNNFCIDIAVCYISDKVYVDIGEQNTSDYSYDETSTSCALTLKGKPITKESKSPHTQINLQCSPNEEGRLEFVRIQQKDENFKAFMSLHTKYACLKSGLSTGSILIIIFICMLVVYLVAGLLFNKYSKGASGKELIPNVNFWTDFPLLVKDGIIFFFECCKRACSRKQSSYESI
ncbi:uncharacterized protein [Montipora foliosa]|uniref:uncharacterized protein n=1 Tax=Montipora foliosa TaxID=591990 RepID=UPI0035F195E2